MLRDKYHQLRQQQHHLINKWKVCYCGLNQRANNRQCDGGQNRQRVVVSLFLCFPGMPIPLAHIGKHSPILFPIVNLNNTVPHSSLPLGV